MGVGDVADQLLARLDEADLAEEVSDLVLAAALGQEDLDAAVGGDRPARPTVPAVEADEPDRVYLDRIAVTGFRGVAETATLALDPGPGVTLVVGRNGSGKSTFAEAAEVALSGRSSRWDDKASTMWRAGWANAHRSGPRSVRVDLRRDGVEQRTKVEVRWADGADLDAGTSVAQPAGEVEVPAEALGFGDHLGARRPFLSYDELGGLWTENPSVRHDRMNVLLGLEDWSGVEGRLRTAHKAIGAAVKEAEQRAKALATEAGGLDDERAARAVTALKKRGGWDLDGLDELATGTAPPDDAIGLLRDLGRLEGPGPVAGVVADLRGAAAALAAVEGSRAEQADELASLLEAALSAHRHDDGAACPVCGAEGRLDDAWAVATTAQVATLREEARAVREAQVQARRATAAVDGLVHAVPGVVTAALGAGLGLPGLTDLAATWDRWAELPTGPADQADHIEAGAAPLAVAVAAVAEAARAEHELRQDRWRPVAEALAAWLPAARSAVDQRPLVARLLAAAKWVQSAAAEVRRERFAPIADQVRSVWEELRHDSNVAIDDLALDGSATRRRLEVTVSVDDERSDAGVALLSQGELHALSLAMFLPRVTSDASPFGFVVIDDPVQAMDGARVDGLARVLSRVGRARQVVVFTHDERLPEAFRSLGLDAKVLEVVRGRRSAVSVRRLAGPSERYLDDARAIALSDPYPDELRRRVVPGLCRRAVEATCIDLGRRRLLDRGLPFDEVEARLGDLKRLRSYLALALFGDAARHDDVDDRLRRAPFGRDAVPTMIAINKGSHGEGGQVDAKDLIRSAQELVARLVEVR